MALFQYFGTLQTSLLNRNKLKIILLRFFVEIFPAFSPQCRVFWMILRSRCFVDTVFIRLRKAVSAKCKRIFLIHLDRCQWVESDLLLKYSAVSLRALLYERPERIRAFRSVAVRGAFISDHLPCCRTRTVSDQSPNVSVIKTLRIFDSLFSVISIRMLWASSLSSVSQSWN